MNETIANVDYEASSPESIVVAAVPVVDHVDETRKHTEATSRDATVDYDTELREKPTTSATITAAAVSAVVVDMAKQRATRRTLSSYAMGVKYRAQFRADVDRRYGRVDSPVLITRRSGDVASRFADPLVNGLRDAAVWCDAHSGELSLTAMADIVVYNDAFGTLDARGLFAALQRVPLDVLGNNLDFAFECVKRTIEQYVKSRSPKTTTPTFGKVAIGSMFRDESIRRMSYYHGCSLTNQPVCGWASDEYAAYIVTEGFLANEYAVDTQPLLFSTRGERILQLLRDHGYASRLEQLFATAPDRLDAYSDGVPSLRLYLIFSDRNVNTMLQSAVSDSLFHGSLSLSDVVSIYRYHERFGHLCAFDLFESLKQVPLVIVREHETFFAECVKYVIAQYTNEIERPPYSMVVVGGDDDDMIRRHSSSARISQQQRQSPPPPPMFVDRRGRCVFACFSAVVFYRDILPALMTLPAWSLDWPSKNHERISVETKNHVTVSTLVLATERVVAFCDEDDTVMPVRTTADERWELVAMHDAYRLLMRAGMIISAIPFSYCVARATVQRSCECTLREYFYAMYSPRKYPYGLLGALEHQRITRGLAECPRAKNRKVEAALLALRSRLDAANERYEEPCEIKYRDNALPPWGYVYANTLEFIVWLFDDCAS